jgi:AbiV family abortive infection protein
MAFLSFKNALSLHRDSVFLFSRHSYGSALSLSVLAAEEIGKYFLIEDLVWHSSIETPWPLEDQEAWLKLAYNHRTKQGQFATAAEITLPKRVFQRIIGGVLEGHK